MRASIILPTYQEGGHIAALIRALREQAPSCQEIIVVDDASPDGTADRIAALNDPAVRLIRRRERGLVSALQAGMDSARGEIVAWMDADFSHPPEVAARLIGMVAAGECEVAVGSRFLAGGGEEAGPGDSGRMRAQQMGSRFANRMMRHLISPVCTDWTSGFAAVTSGRIKGLRLEGYYGDYFIRLMGALIAAGVVVREAGYVSPPRRSGETKTATGWMRLAKLAIFYARSVREARRLLRASA